MFISKSLYNKFAATVVVIIIGIAVIAHIWEMHMIVFLIVVVVMTACAVVSTTFRRNVDLFFFLAVADFLRQVFICNVSTAIHTDRCRSVLIHVSACCGYCCCYYSLQMLTFGKHEKVDLSVFHKCILSLSSHLHFGHRPAKAKRSKAVSQWLFFTYFWAIFHWQIPMSWEIFFRRGEQCLNLKQFQKSISTIIRDIINIELNKKLSQL